MHQALRRIRYSPSPIRSPSDLSCNIPTASLARSSTRPPSSAALVFPSVVPSFSTRRLFGSGGASPGGAQKPWSIATSDEPILSSIPLERSKDGELGQGELYRDVSQDLSWPDSVRSETSERLALQNVGLDPGLDKTSLKEPHGVAKRYSDSDDRAWDLFLSFRGTGNFSPIVDRHAESFRNNILSAALNDSTRMPVFYEIAQHLRNELKFEWPELYTRILHFYLDQAEYDTAYLWHLRLMSTFTPNTNDFRALLVSFAFDPAPELQIVLKKLYELSFCRSVYDHLIPTLFEYGHSQTARAWRKQLVLHGDLPSTPKSRPFLQFCQQYYPLTHFTREELELAHYNRVTAATKFEDPNPPRHTTTQLKGVYSDSFTARWFASSWASVEFAINMMHKLGLRTIGPRSLQSLALREDNVQEVASRILQLETLGIAITQTIYCKALVSFAKGHQQDLLTDLLLCDIHPEEFDDAKTRRMLMDAAKREQDSKRERLLQEVQWATIGRPKKVKGPPLKDLNRILKRTLAKSNLGHARLILDRMESLDVKMSHANSANILEQVFDRLWYFPKKTQQRRHGVAVDPYLDRAIHIIRRVARHDVAIPLRCWRIILYNLGRLGRFDELEELSYELIDLYALAPEGLFPVHGEDLPPKHKSKAAKKIESKTKKFLGEDLGTSDKDPENWPQLFLDEFWRNEMGLGDTEEPSKKHGRRGKRTAPNDDIHYIPTDLPLSHQQHPMAKLFDASLQRAIVRWSFDTKLALAPHPGALLRVTEPSAAGFDIAWGVRFLAILRDQGLHIDSQVLKSVLISRIVMAKVPGRRRHRARDDRELSPSNLKRLVDEAWGAELLPPLPHFIQELENHKPKLWDRYPKLLAAAYESDEDRAEEEEGMWAAETNQDRLQDRQHTWAK
ncbi:hypothetical protein EDB80DRAFT_728008 [Ilyonectria destructans]|nr:hypothetical protein EDB80DRAFT_728008 [Ilyonectria destructans]